MKKFTVKIGCGFIACFSRQHEIVQTCDGKSDAKKFTEASYKKFIDNYSDCGYGFSHNKAEKLYL